MAIRAPDGAKNCREISRAGRLVEYPFKESFFGSKMQKVHAVVIILHQSLHNYQNCHRLHLSPSTCDQAADSIFAILLLQLLSTDHRAFSSAKLT